MQINLSPVRIGQLERELINEVLNSGQLAQGPMVNRFECQFAEMSGVNSAVAVSSGTAALELGLRAMDLKPGDEVITTPFTFVATINAILLAGGTVRFADINSDTFTIDPKSISKLLGPSTKVILPVHLYGLPADMDAISELAADADLRIIEDAAQSHFAQVGSRPIGSLDVGCFSLYATKNVTAGEGGVITTNDHNLARKLRILRNQGMDGRYQYVLVGHNFRFNELAAAIGLGQLSRALAELAARTRNAAYLTQGLKDLPNVILPSVPNHMRHVWHQYTIRVLKDRNGFRDFLAEQGIQTGIYYPRLISDYPPFSNHDRVHLDKTPIASEIVNEVLSLPVHGGLTEAALDYIIGTCHAYSNQHR